MPARWTLPGTSSSRSSGAAPRILEPDGRARHVYFPDRDICHPFCQQQGMSLLRFHVAKITVEPRECATGGLGRLYLIQNAGGPSHGTVRDGRECLVESSCPEFSVGCPDVIVLISRNSTYPPQDNRQQILALARATQKTNITQSKRSSRLSRIDRFRGPDYLLFAKSLRLNLRRVCRDKWISRHSLYDAGHSRVPCSLRYFRFSRLAVYDGKPRNFRTEHIHMG
jgi:hypothetical protein